MSACAAVAAIAAALCAGSAVGSTTPAAAPICPPNPTSTIEQLVSWRRADVVTARLANGVIVHHRRMPDAAFTVVAATLTPGFDDDAIGAAAARAAERALKGDQRANGLTVDVIALEQGLMALMRGPDERSGDMCGLIARLASEPVEFSVREAGAWAGSTGSVVRRAIDAVLDQRPIVIKPGGLDVGMDAPVRRWPDASAPGSVEVSIVGGVAMAAALAGADSALGGLSARTAPVAAASCAPPPKRATQVLTIHSNEMKLPEGREAVAVGLLVRNGETLKGQRTIALASTLLRGRFKDAPQQPGAEFANLWVEFEPRGLRPGTAVVTITASCPAGQGGQVATQFQEAFRALTAPADEAEFERARSAYLDQTRRLLGDVTYWAKVLATCSTRGYSPDELAAVESDLKALTPAEVAGVMATALGESGPITIYVRPPDGPESVRPVDKVGQP